MIKCIVIVDVYRLRPKLALARKLLAVPVQVLIVVILYAWPILIGVVAYLVSASAQTYSLITSRTRQQLEN